MLGISPTNRIVSICALLPSISSLHHRQTMLTAIQLTAFWTDTDQMGLTSRTRKQMAAEGLTTPDDFEDFPAKGDLEGLFKLLLKPAKEMSGTGTTATLKEVAAYVIPAKSQIRLQGVRKIVAYYEKVGRTITASDVMWPVVKNYVEQHKALMEKKEADVGLPPKLTKDKLVYKWLESLQQYLSDKIGVRDAPLSYLTRVDVAAPATMLPRDGDQPFSASFTSIEDELRACVSHTHNLYRSDNTALFQMLDRAVTGHDVNATIAPFRRTNDGRGAYLAIVNQHAGRHIWDKIVKEATAVLQTRIWNGTTSTTLLQHTTMHRRSYIQLTEAAVHTPAEVPNERQRVTFLLDSMKTADPKMLAGMAMVEQDDAGRRVKFEDTVTFLLPSCPVAAKNVKGAGLNAKVSGTSGATGTTPASGGGSVAVGKTGVQLRWHAPDKFTELTKEQRKELSIWNRAHPSEGDGKKRSGGGDRTGRSKRAKVASTKANAIMTALADSHSAEMAAMSAKISAMTSGVPTGTPTTIRPAGPPATFPPSVGHYGPSQYDLDEKARVASIKLQSILKPPSKKDKKDTP